jgi:tellurite methyltransferase
MERDHVIAWVLVGLQAILLIAILLIPAADHWSVNSGVELLARALQLLGLVLGIWGALVLGAGLTASPLPNRRAGLVTRGPYRWVRHPIYTAVLAFMAGVVVLSGSWYSAGAWLLLLGLLLSKSGWEEHRLIEAFPDYPRYQGSSGRFLPRVRSVAGDAGFDWDPFLEGTADRDPLPFFSRAMEFVDGHQGKGRLAIDLGCGGGADTRALLDRGWRVFATDAAESSRRLLEERVPPEERDHLEIQIGRFDELDLPGADLVYAQFSLPFAGAYFEDAVDHALSAVRQGGAFTGHFLGLNDDWVGEGMIAAVTREWVERRFADFSHVEIDEFDDEGPLGLEGETKHWHYYFVLARK